MKASKVDNNLLSWFVQNIFRLIFSRFTIAIVMLFFQIGMIILCVLFFNHYLILLFGGSAFFGLVITIYIINQNANPSFQISWIILILLVPTVGVFIYLFVKLQIGVIALSKRYQSIRDDMSLYSKQDEKIYENVKEKDNQVAHYVTYMNQISGYPIYQNTKTTFFPLGEKMFSQFLEDLKKAKYYIFLEYFIVAKGVMWNSILEILKEKVKSGVQVYFMYDGTCSFQLLPLDYPKTLESFGIHVKVFNPVVPIISTQYNNRDHRKIAVMDGSIAYTGGINLADEYINQKERFGVWKDTALRLEGEAVRSFVLLFLENWNATSKEQLDVNLFLKVSNSIKDSSFVLPFGDNPFDDYPVGKVTYEKILHTAKKYVHVIMPYFIIDHEFLMSFCNAARSGVEVKLILPGIPDKKLIYYISRTFYSMLLKSGVEIYEYHPGFTHAKMFISDDEKAVIGTINLDFRSLYLHFENAVYLYQDQTIFEMEKDYQTTLNECKKITMETVKKFPWWQKIIGKILRVFAPLL